MVKVTAVLKSRSPFHPHKVDIQDTKQLIMDRLFLLNHYQRGKLTLIDMDYILFLYLDILTQGYNKLSSYGNPHQVNSSDMNPEHKLVVRNHLVLHPETPNNDKRKKGEKVPLRRYSSNSKRYPANTINSVNGKTNLKKDKYGKEYIEVVEALLIKLK